jgi:hypothetical protein
MASIHFEFCLMIYSSPFYMFVVLKIVIMIVGELLSSFLCLTMVQFFGLDNEFVVAKI